MNNLTNLNIKIDWILRFWMFMNQNILIAQTLNKRNSCIATALRKPRWQPLSFNAGPNSLVQVHEQNQYVWCEPRPRTSVV